jgi:hypothetical protein
MVPDRGPGDESFRSSVRLGDFPAWGLVDGDHSALTPRCVTTPAAVADATLMLARTGLDVKDRGATLGEVDRVGQALPDAAGRRAGPTGREAEGDGADGRL